MKAQTEPETDPALIQSADKRLITVRQQRGLRPGRLCSDRECSPSIIAAADWRARRVAGNLMMVRPLENCDSMPTTSGALDDPFLLLPSSNRASAIPTLGETAEGNPCRHDAACVSNPLAGAAVTALLHSPTLAFEA